MFRTSQGRALVRTLAVCLVVATLAGSMACASREERLVAARDAALAYFPAHVTQLEVGWSVIFGYLHRRFGVTVAIADGRTAHDAREDVVPPHIFRVFRRLVEPGARVEVIEIAELESPIDRISAAAIHCNEIRLPDDWVDVLQKATDKGAYALTHGVAAAEWTLENGCREELDFAGLHIAQVRALQALLDDRAGLAARHAAADDIWIEALVMLYYSGAGDRVRPEWIDQLLDLQRSDGGWAAHPRHARSDPHATALALWVLLEILEPDAPRIPWIPGR